MRRLLSTALVVLLSCSVLAGAGVAVAAGDVTPRASLTDIENDVMCVSCKEPLAVAESPQAYAERGYIRRLIAQGQTKAQIERALVAQYGPAVLGRPPADGFNLTVYVLPPSLVVLGAAILAFTLPKWRRRARAARAGAGSELGPAGAAGGRIGDEDARRLDEDLARHV